MKPILISALLVFAVLSCNNQPDFENGFAEVNGTSIYYEVAGEGSPIVFIHGNFGDRRHWDFQFTPLSKKYKVVRYDVRSFGKSAMPKPDEPYSDISDLKALLDYLGIEKAHICGLSRGSAVAVDFALEHSEMCFSLIPIGPWAGGFGFGKFKSASADSLYAIFPTANKILRTQGPKEATDYMWKGNNCLARAVRNPATLDSLLIMGYEYTYWSHLNSSPIKSLSPSAMSSVTRKQICSIFGK